MILKLKSFQKLMIINLTKKYIYVHNNIRNIIRTKKNKKKDNHDI